MLPAAAMSAGAAVTLAAPLPQPASPPAGGPPGVLSSTIAERVPQPLVVPGAVPRAANVPVVATTSFLARAPGPALGGAAHPAVEAPALKSTAPVLAPAPAPVWAWAHAATPAPAPRSGFLPELPNPANILATLG